MDDESDFDVPTDEFDDAETDGLPTSAWRAFDAVYESEELPTAPPSAEIPLPARTLVQAPSRGGWDDPLIYRRAGMIFLGSFAATTLAVLGPLLAIRGVSSPAVAPQIVMAAPPVMQPKAPVPPTVPAVATTPPAPAAPVAVAPVEPVAAAPRAARSEPVSPSRRSEPAPIQRTAPEPVPVAEAPVAEVAPVAPVAIPAPVAAPPPVVAAPKPTPKAPVPTKVKALNGAFTGKADGRMVWIRYQFEPEGKLRAVVRRDVDGVTTTIAARGEWTLAATGRVTFALMEVGMEKPGAYFGHLEGDAGEGRVTYGGRGRGRFEVKR